MQDDTGAAKRILIVDDEPDASALVRRLLEDRGYSVRAVKNPLETSDAADAFQPHLIILDFDMPQLVGSELCVQLKSAPATRRVPVVFLSGMIGRSFREIAAFTGAVEYLDKPVDAKKLIETVETLLAFPAPSGDRTLPGTQA